MSIIEPKIERLEKATVVTETTIRDGLSNLDASGLGILLVSDSEKSLVGVVTDGDIRRYLLRNGSLDAPISEIMNEDFFSLPFSKRRLAVEVLQKKGIDQIPILDEDGRAVDLVTVLDFVKVQKRSFDNPVVIIAGGQGTRLLPLTKIIPKPLVPIGDKTIIEMIMDKFRKNGFHDFRIIVNYKKELIKSYFCENKIDKASQFIEEDEFLGTAGGLRLLSDSIDGTFMVSNCDVIADLDYERMLGWHREHGADMTVLGVRKEVSVPYGVIKLDSENYVTDIDEKPIFSLMIISGIYVLEPSVFEFVAGDGPLGMDDLIKRIIASRGKISCFPIENGWSDIGQIEEYKQMLNSLGIFRE